MNGGKRTREFRDKLLVNLSACKYPLVREAAERLGYEVTDDETELWDLFWSDLSVSVDRVQRLLPFQRLNHFPGMLEICRKAALSRHMARMAARLPTEFRYYPHSLVLPDQLDLLLTALKKNQARVDAAVGPAGGGGSGGEGGGGGGVATYILKPSAGTQGRGIALVQFPGQLAEVGDVGTCVAQAYVSSPLLLDGFKFDLRVYALVASVDPLTIHLYDEGLARLATQPYKPPSTSNLRITTMHLTNYAVNKGAVGFVSADAAPAGGGSKRPMSAVLAQLASQHGTTSEALLESIGDVVTKTIMAIQPLLAHTYHTSLSASSAAAAPHPCGRVSLDHAVPSASDPGAPCGCPASLCFELLGFDIMFDTALRPWLLEVNHSPSFAGDSRLDRAIKGEMLARAMQLLGQHTEARRAFLEAEVRAQNERLYSSPAGHASFAAAYGVAPGAAGGGQGVRRAMSAVPRSRQLQITAAALDEITASSAALLAAGGGHVWGVGTNTNGQGNGYAYGSYGGYGTSGINRPFSSNATCSSGANGASNGAFSPQRSQCMSSNHHNGNGSSNNTSGSGGIGGGGGGGNSGNGPTRRCLSFSGGAGGGGSSGGGGGASGGGAGGHGSGGSVGGSGSFRQVYPATTESERKRYALILQTAADLFPQQRCQCAWCRRRHQVALLTMTQQQLGLVARPPSAVYGGLAGHLPVRPSSTARLGGGGSARARSSGSAVHHRSGGGGEEGASDGDGGGGYGGGEGRVSGGMVEGTASRSSSGGGARSTDGLSLRAKPPRPTSASRGARTPASASAGSMAYGTQAGRSSPPGHMLTQSHSNMSYPPPPTLASVFASGSFNGHGHGASLRSQYAVQRGGSAAFTTTALSGPGVGGYISISCGGAPPLGRSLFGHPGEEGGEGAVTPTLSVTMPVLGHADSYTSNDDDVAMVTSEGPPGPSSSSHRTLRNTPSQVLPDPALSPAQSYPRAHALLIALRPLSHHSSSSITSSSSHAQEGPVSGGASGGVNRSPARVKLRSEQWQHQQQCATDGEGHGGSSVVVNKHRVINGNANGNVSERPSSRSRQTPTSRSPGGRVGAVPMGRSRTTGYQQRKPLDVSGDGPGSGSRQLTRSAAAVVGCQTANGHGAVGTVEGRSARAALGPLSAPRDSGGRGGGGGGGNGGSGGNLDNGSDDTLLDDRSGEHLRRSFSCSQLEAAFRNMLGSTARPHCTAGGGTTVPGSRKWPAPKDHGGKGSGSGGSSTSAKATSGSSLHTQSPSHGSSSSLHNPRHHAGLLSITSGAVSSASGSETEHDVVATCSRVDTGGGKTHVMPSGSGAAAGPCGVGGVGVGGVGGVTGSTGSRPQVSILKGSNGSIAATRGRVVSAPTPASPKAVASSGTGAAGPAVPRVGYLSAKRAAANAAMSQADLEIMLVRVRTASMLNNRYVSVYTQGSLRGGDGGSARTPR